MTDDDWKREKKQKIQSGNYEQIHVYLQSTAYKCVFTVLKICDASRQKGP
jgi:hypothetical protein